MDRKSFIRRSGAATLGLCVLLAFNPASARKVERGVEPVHQPVVQRTDFVLDIAPDGSGSLSSYEQARLTAWFNALGLGYGDHVSIADGGRRSALPLHDAIGEVVGRFGLLVEGEAPATAGIAGGGAVRVVVSRSTASVPSCPSWRGRAEANFAGGLSDNYGCATAGNIAAMIADPRDLVEGRESGLEAGSVVSGKAIKAYQDRAPSGAAGLSGGN